MSDDIRRDDSGTRYLSIDDVVQIVGAFVDASPHVLIQDIGLLIGAVNRPALRYRGLDVYPSLADKAAALMEGLARPAALDDGNKRLAWLATNVFLELNGAELHLTDNEAFSLLREVAQGHVSTRDLSMRLQSRLGPWPPEVTG